MTAHYDEHAVLNAERRTKGVVMFNQEYLEKHGFGGFVPLLETELVGCVPSQAGVYVVLAEGREEPAFAGLSCGGRFKRKDPTVDRSILRSKFVCGCETVYIGRATRLDRRVHLLARFGRGEPVAHWGGRYLWQLERPESLRVAWRVEADPVEAEASLLDDFETAFGQLPFANLIRGNRSLAHA
jgi:hypothetical protein